MLSSDQDLICALTCKGWYIRLYERKARVALNSSVVRCVSGVCRLILVHSIHSKGIWKAQHRVTQRTAMQHGLPCRFRLQLPARSRVLRCAASNTAYQSASVRIACYALRCLRGCRPFDCAQWDGAAMTPRPGTLYSAEFSRPGTLYSAEVSRPWFDSVDQAFVVTRTILPLV